MNSGIHKRFKGLLPVVIDIETVYFDPQRNALLEVAAVFMDYDQGVLRLSIHTMNMSFQSQGYS